MGKKVITNLFKLTETFQINNQNPHNLHKVTNPPNENYKPWSKNPLFFYSHVRILVCFFPTARLMQKRSLNKFKVTIFFSHNSHENLFT